MQTLLDSLDTSTQSKSELLSFYLQSTLQSFLSPTLRLHHLTKPRLPLVRNIHTRTGTWWLVKDDWVLLNDDAHASAHAGAQAHPHPHPHAHQTPIHLRLVCILDLIRTGTATDFSTIDIDQRFLSIFRDITLGTCRVVSCRVVPAPAPACVGLNTVLIMIMIMFMIMIGDNTTQPTRKSQQRVTGSTAISVR
ncbi:hypothetical protein J132_11328 [Termitomyces sp. J132]|nr:hypothetical protein H2248_001822 [Termitomyces sp. 'cryptogamus']KNZ76208.1 hypothetical protein J132_11328 [Termitomyces sp. J132]